MGQGIRSFCNAKFAEYLPQFQSGELDGTAFRAKVMAEVVEQFGINVPSAATHYNFSLKQQRANYPETILNLGRPEDKKGGRKPKAVVETATKTQEEMEAAEQAQREEVSGQ